MLSLHLITVSPSSLPLQFWKVVLLVQTNIVSPSQAGQFTSVQEGGDPSGMQTLAKPVQTCPSGHAITVPGGTLSEHKLKCVSFRHLTLLSWQVLHVEAASTTADMQQMATKEHCVIFRI